MGEAKRKKGRVAEQERSQREEREKWLESLPYPEKTLVSTALALHVVLPLDGACYRAALFLKCHLETAHKISGTAVVGFVNDGTDDVYSSHAWYELDGKITDIALSRPLHPKVQKRGPVLVHGRQVEDGWSRYTYHLVRPPVGIALLTQLLQQPHLRAPLEEAETLHIQMTTKAKDNHLIKTYLDAAPDGIGYQALSDRLRVR